MLAGSYSLENDSFFAELAVTEQGMESIAPCSFRREFLAIGGDQLAAVDLDDYSE